MLVMVSLYANGTMRFNDVQRSIGDISQRMLAVTLRGLEDFGLVAREVFPEVPPRVEYSITDRTRSLLPHVNSLIAWAKENMPAILRDRESHGKLKK